MTSSNWIILKDAEAVATEARDRILTVAKTAIRERGLFRLVLAGGSTPERTYELLTESQAKWKRWHIYFGDERCLPADHPDRNSRMAQQAFTGKVPIPLQQLHLIPAELGAEAAAENYGREIEPALPFDLVLLGMGEDGHTASLFPGHHQPENILACAVHNAPKAPLERVTLSPAALANSREMLFLITGENKREAVTAWLEGSDLPVARVARKGRYIVLTDRAASPG
jgi:6-phosphogluconolactonase